MDWFLYDIGFRHEWVKIDDCTNFIHQRGIQYGNFILEGLPCTQEVRLMEEKVRRSFYMGISRH